MTTGRINQVTTAFGGGADAASADQSVFDRPLNAEPWRLARRSFEISFRSHRGTPHTRRTAERSQLRPLGWSSPRSTAAAFFISPSEHSLRGRNTQDCRVRIESRPARLHRSERFRFTDTIARRRPPHPASEVSQPAIDFSARKRAHRARRQPTAKLLDFAIANDSHRIRDRRRAFFSSDACSHIYSKTFAYGLWLHRN
jgi:hypothetical protein